MESSFDNSKTDTNINLNNNNYIKESKEKLLKTPSTLCNYYDKSEATTSQKKNSINNINNNNIKNELRKNLDDLYEETKNEGIDYINVNDIWNYLKDTKWKISKNLVLCDMVNDIFSLDNKVIDNYVKGEIRKNKVKPNLEDDLNGKEKR